MGQILYSWGRADIKYNNQGVVNGVHLQRSLGEQMG